MPDDSEENLGPGESQRSAASKQPVIFRGRRGGFFEWSVESASGAEPHQVALCDTTGQA